MTESAMERDGGRERDRSGARARRSRTPNARLRVELHIGALVIDDLGTGSPDALVAAMTAELQAALSRELAVLGQVDGQARAAELVAGLSADRVRAAGTLPPAAPARWPCAVGRRPPSPAAGRPPAPP